MQTLQRLVVVIDREHLKTLRRQQAAMASTATSEIQNRSTRPDIFDPASYPVGGLIR